MGVNDFCARGTWRLDGAGSHAIRFVLWKERRRDGGSDDDIRVGGRRGGGGCGDGETSGQGRGDLQVGLGEIFEGEGVGGGDGSGHTGNNLCDDAGQKRRLGRLERGSSSVLAAIKGHAAIGQRRGLVDDGRRAREQPLAETRFLRRGHSRSTSKSTAGARAAKPCDSHVA